MLKTKVFSDIKDCPLRQEKIWFLKIKSKLKLGTRNLNFCQLVNFLVSRTGFITLKTKICTWRVFAVKFKIWHRNYFKNTKIIKEKWRKDNLEKNQNL